MFRPSSDYLQGVLCQGELLNSKGKGARNRPEGPDGVEVKLFSFVTSALEEGGWSAPRSGRFTPRKTRYSLYSRLGGPQGRSGHVRKMSPPPGFNPRTVQHLASRYSY
jgi:hypothetical protein